MMRWQKDGTKEYCETQFDKNFDTLRAVCVLFLSALVSFLVIREEEEETKIKGSKILWSLHTLFNQQKEEEEEEEHI